MNNQDKQDAATNRRTAGRPTELVGRRDIAISIDANRYALLTAAAAERGMTVSALIRAIIDEKGDEL